MIDEETKSYFYNMEKQFLMQQEIIQELTRNFLDNFPNIVLFSIYFDVDIEGIILTGVLFDTEENMKLALYEEAFNSENPTYYQNNLLHNSNRMIHGVSLNDKDLSMIALGSFLDKLKWEYSQWVSNKLANQEMHFSKNSIDADVPTYLLEEV